MAPARSALRVDVDLGEPEEALCVWPPIYPDETLPGEGFPEHLCEPGFSLHAEMKVPIKSPHGLYASPEGDVDCSQRFADLDRNYSSMLDCPTSDLRQHKEAERSTRAKHSISKKRLVHVQTKSAPQSLRDALSAKPTGSRVISLDLGSDDEVLRRMKEAGYKDGEIAQTLAKQGRIHYSDKTIGTRWGRLKRAMEEYENRVLDDEQTDFHEGDDDILRQAYVELRPAIDKQVTEIEDRFWQQIQQRAKELMGGPRFSKNALRERWNGLQNGTAEPPLEQDSDLQGRLQRRLDRANARKQKESNGAIAVANDERTSARAPRTVMDIMRQNAMDDKKRRQTRRTANTEKCPPRVSVPESSSDSSATALKVSQITRSAPSHSPAPRRSATMREPRTASMSRRAPEGVHGIAVNRLASASFEGPDKAEGDRDHSVGLRSLPPLISMARERHEEDSS